MSFTDLTNANMAPKEAKKIGVYNSSGTRVGEIKLNSLQDSGSTPLYKFGLISDIHTDGTDYEYEQYEEAYPYSDEGFGDLCRALKWFRDNESVDLVCACGDLSQYGTDEELARSQSAITNMIPTIPFYTCTGNHDVYSGHYSATTFATYTRRTLDTTAYNLTESTAYNNSFCFDKTTTAGTDHFIFFSMVSYSLGSTATPYSEADIAWLKSKLEEFDGDRVFVFSHLFFPDYAGNLGRVNGVGGIYPSSNWLGGTQLNEMLNLFVAYPKVVWFSGHSHWKWNLQKYQKNTNVARYGSSGGWTVHVPSSALPIDSDYTDITTETDTNRVEKPLESQGGVVYVYDNRIVVKGIDFNVKNSEQGGTDEGYTGDTYVRYLPIASYSLYTDGTPSESGSTGQSETVDTSMLYLNTAKAYTGMTISGYTVDDDNYLAFSFSANSAGLILSCEEFGSTMTGITMDADEVKIYYVDSTGAETEMDTADTSYIGWLSSYDEETSTSIYSLASHFTGTYGLASSGGEIYSGYCWDEYAVSGTGSTLVTKYGIQFNTSSKFSTSGTTSWPNYSSLGTFGTDWSVKVVIKNLSATPLYGEDTGTTADTVLKVTLTTKSSGMGISADTTSYTTAYVKYDDIKITVNGTDETSSIVSTATTASNSYSLGIYNSNSKYQYAPAGSTVIAALSTSNYVIPLAQVSSSSVLTAGTYTVVVQMKNIQYSFDNSTWYSIDSNSTNIVNGSSWSKTDVTYEWVSDIE